MNVFLLPQKFGFRPETPLKPQQTGIHRNSKTSSKGLNDLLLDIHASIMSFSIVVSHLQNHIKLICVPSIPTRNIWCNFQTFLPNQSFNGFHQPSSRFIFKLCGPRVCQPCCNFEFRARSLDTLQMMEPYCSPNLHWYVHKLKKLQIYKFPCHILPQWDEGVSKNGFI